MCTPCCSAYTQAPGTRLLCPQPVGTLYLKRSKLDGLPRDFHRWLWQVGILQRAFPNSTLKLDSAVYTDEAAHIHHLLTCTELRGLTFWAASDSSYRRQGPFWQAIAALGRLHGGRLQLWESQLASPMLVAEPSLAAHISGAALSRRADAGSSVADQVSRLSSLTKLVLHYRPVLGEAGTLDALRQLSALQSLRCVGDILQTLLVSSVPSSWSLLTRLETTRQDLGPNWSRVEQQCAQLDALSLDKSLPLCLMALTSLTCHDWLPQDTDSFECPQLGHFHMQQQSSFDLGLLPSTLTSLSCGQLKAHNQA